MTTELYVITDQAIQLEDVVNKVERREAGAITTFIGTVREWTKGKQTLYLEYQAYVPMAIKKMEEISNEALEKWPDSKIAVTHRIGRLEISDVAIVIAVSSPHREAAYRANQYVIERMKQVVPIWKKEHWEDGETWIGDQSGNVSYPEGAPTKKDVFNG
ncbi:molybdenum cofactor biosynthesis protein MoaE [Paraliobacillus sediminis]|uniref:molybdenum cofactor biosynthesis protein MoaE n=1 Tax=Paraliobacillus sediminis TaxID=1885916 RepID=UPI000E3C06C6|nr:molybdenum cofactor biosynthesis protein MoaE [Paraliobacillus sediminis]